MDPAVHVFLWGNPNTTARDLQLAKDAGFHWVKQRFEWRNIEGHGKGNFEWNEPDRILDAISQTGLKVIARVDNQPQWASSSIVWPGSGPPDNPKDWTDYLTALASRYKGRIQAYEIWNEPNLDREWGNKSPDPAAYAGLLEASYTAIKAADPQAIVISAGMSPTTTNNQQAIPELEYIQRMYAAGAKGSFDVLGVHAAGYKAEPCSDPAAVAAVPDLTNNDPSPPDLRRVYAFRHVEDVRALMLQQGDGGKQMGVMEMGYTTDVRPGSAYQWFAVDRDQQARNLVAAFQCARQNWQPWMGMMTVIYIPDPAWTQQDEQYWWSITNPDGSVRPAYTSLKNLFTSN
ncbi:MAG: cellulase family glycosylhydrolase [Chloroflexi bacterium]|nr:cellulase family glycosylhydrolase [Chloroflexota bacterium]